MTALIIATVSAVAAAGSCIVSFWAVRVSMRQASIATDSYNHARQISQSDAVIHFADQYFNIVRDGKKFKDPNWLYRYWNLLTVEFYFFRNRWIPQLVYSLWMVELASLYADSENAWKSHGEYLKQYSSNYPEMQEFFEEIGHRARRHRTDNAARNRIVAEYVDGWNPR